MNEPEKHLSEVLEVDAKEWVEVEFLGGVDEADNFGGSQVIREARPSCLEFKFLCENELAKARYLVKTNKKARRIDSLDVNHFSSGKKGVFI